MGDCNMGKVLILLVMVLFNGLRWHATATNHSTRPAFANLGALFSFNTTVGKIVKIALQTAVDDVNSDTSILNQTKLRLSMQEDSKYKGFLSIAEALELMEKDTVAIIGPQTSITAHVISHIADELQVPLVSFSASDPTLSSLQYPFFVRFVHSDNYQMSAVADIVEYYQWREVVAIYVDDDHGRGGISALGDKLAEKRCKISFKAPMSPSATQVEITDVLVKVALQESRILVVHTNTFYGPQIVRVARSLGMLGTGYVWIATYWLSTVLDTDSPLLADDMEDIQGILTLRVYTPESVVKRKFVSRWRNLTRGKNTEGPLGLSTFGLYAYDSVWFLARALETFFNQGNAITFSNDSKLANLGGGNLNLDALKIFNEGKLFLNSILGVNMTGVAGQIEYTDDRNLVHPAYEVINVIGTGSRRIGYWSNYSGLSVQLPETFYSKPSNRSRANQQLLDVIWPGQTTQKPRGWVFPNTGRLLQIGVPIRISFRDFVSQVEGTDNFKGYCIDVFTAAVQFLPYAVPFRFVPFGDGINNPSHTELVRLITTGTFDAAVGDITITTNRTKMADFTQPFIESGLVVVAPVHKGHTDVFAFLRPFTPMMWCVTAISFLVVGAVVWVLEHRLNDEFRGPPRKQIVTTLWFTFSTMFFAHRENTVSTLGRSVLIIWLFVVLIINSSYTASLTSILTVQQLSSPIKGIETLKYSKDPIGYQQGSFTANYLIAEYGIEESRLVPLKTTEETARALKNGPQRGGVAAYVDERAYMELFLSSQCEFSIIGQEFTKSGWGFAFQRDSPLAVDLSTAILKLSETGELQRIHDKWLFRSACTSQGAKLEVDRLELKSFVGLYSLCGLACLIALLVYLALTLCQYRKHCPDEIESSTAPSVRSGRLQTFLSFVNQKEEEAKAQSKRRKMEISSNKSNIDADSVNGSIHRFPDTPSNNIQGAYSV